MTHDVRRRLMITVCATAATATALAGCGSSGSQSAKKTSGSTGAHTATVTISAGEGCVADSKSFAAGGITFAITNKDATAVSEVELRSGERIVGEVENIPPGFNGKFSANVTAGKYTMYCPGATKENTTLTVTGKAPGQSTSATALLAQATTAYKSYVDTQLGYLLTSTKALNTALHGTSLTAAQEAYMRARPYYEKIEPVAESFQIGNDNLDADIDARINDVAPGATWTGFHRIEQGLFTKKSLSGLGTLGDGLVAKVGELKTKAAAISYHPAELANGASDLLNEVGTTKITGEEERYSHIDVLDLANNIEGSQQAFADLQPYMQTVDPTLTSSISQRFTSLNDLVNKLRTGTNPSGYVYYSALNATDKRDITALTEALKAPLSTVGSKVAGA